MNAKNVLYWATTGLLALAMGAGGVADLSGAMTEGFAHIGYPPILGPILGVWKILGVITLLAPGFPRLKEWAYAGFVFNMTGAAVSHLAAGDGIGGAMAPLVLLVLFLVSWATRPASRVLGQVLPASTPGATAVPSGA